jgi:hypothetical protein
MGINKDFSISAFQLSELSARTVNADQKATISAGNWSPNKYL